METILIVVLSLPVVVIAYVLAFMLVRALLEV
jgi:hypothetical protein